MKLNELRDTSHAISKSKGWHDEDAPYSSFEDRLALIVSELSEALEEYRAGHRETEIYFVQHGAVVWSNLARTPAVGAERAHVEALSRARAAQKPEGIPIELADVVIRIGDDAGRYGFDLENLVSDIFGPDATLGVLGEKPLAEDEPASFGAWLCEITKTVMEAYGGRYPARALALSLWAVARMCNYCGIDLTAAVEIKAAFNQTRSHRHGGKKI